MGVSARRTISRILGTVIVLAVIAGCGFAYLHKQEISDHFAAQRFVASEEIAALTDRISLTDAGRRVFYATSPTLDASQRFNEQCAEVEHSEEGHILGCYSRDSIHLFKVVDERLNGIVEVTAAHELLHAVFARLGDGERAEISEKLRTLYEDFSAQDPTLAERMSVYSELSPEAFANELHSVLATEVRELPDWLEAHYAGWFEDRGAIIDHFDAYHEVFEAIQARADELQAQLASIREDVESRSADYDVAVQQFNTDVEEFNRRNQAYEFSGNEAEFWALRNTLEQRAAALNAERDAIQAEVTHYEELRQELERLNATNQELNQNLDSNLAPPATTAMA